MESIVKSNTFGEENRRMTLRGYFNSLPNAIHPKRDLIDKVCERCKVPYTTARSWFAYGIKPSKPDHIKILSEVTGISPENLWED